MRFTATRRALVFILYSEGPLVVGLPAFLLFPGRPAILVVAVVLSILIGMPGAIGLWAGRREFGPAWERGVRRAFLAFTGLALGLLFAFFQVTEVVSNTLSTTDLYAPWAFLGLALACDALAMAFLLGPLLVEGQRHWVRLVLILAGVGLAAYGYLGFTAVQGYVERSGGEALVPAEIASYARDFTLEVVRLWAAALLALRIGFLPGLYRALQNVAEAEEDAAAKVSSPA